MDLDLILAFAGGFFFALILRRVLCHVKHPLAKQVDIVLFNGGGGGPPPPD